MELFPFSFVALKSLNTVSYHEGETLSATFKPNKGHDFLALFINQVPKRFQETQDPTFMVPFISIDRLIGDQTKVDDQLVEVEDGQNHVLQVLRKDPSTLTADDAKILHQHLHTLLDEQGLNIKS